MLVKGGHGEPGRHVGQHQAQDLVEVYARIHELLPCRREPDQEPLGVLMIMTGVLMTGVLMTFSCAPKGCVCSAARAWKT